ncbi:hypothetical protein HYS31_00560 [Candidatus Woesearchaeota archaeon]|nr:hypothetical protein [Candidatus Woesearchaeota archaeon]
MRRKKRGNINHGRFCLLLSFLALVVFFSFGVYAQSIEHGVLETDSSKQIDCEIRFSGGGCGQTCTKTDQIQTDECTVSVKLRSVNVDDEGRISTLTQNIWNWDYCACNCGPDHTGKNCGKSDSPNTVIPFSRGSPIDITVYAKNDCKSLDDYNLWGVIRSNYEITKVKCDEDYECKATGDNVECVPICQPPKISEGKIGEIKYVQCKAAEYLFDGRDWQLCDGNFWNKLVSGREYLCIGRGKGSIVECCGDSANDCKSSNEAGKRLTTGQLTKPSNFENEDVPGNYLITGNVVSGPGDENSNTYYCKSNKKFATDLDTSDGQSACEKAGLKWTGTKCCSEADDKICTLQYAQITPSGCPAEFNGCMIEDAEGCTEKTESYNDPGTIGGCWNSSFVRSIDFVNGTNFSVINFGGAFHGCKITIKPQEDKIKILGKTDSHTGSVLVRDHDACFNDPDKRYYCSPRGWWNQTFGTDKTYFSSAPSSNVPIYSECCSATQCWNGSVCIDSQRNSPNAKPFGDTNLRCIDGQWIELGIKYTPDGEKTGFCPSDTECLVNPDAQATDKCIPSGNYTIDNYCDKGNWSSRTKLLALKMLEMKGNDFILFCDTRENVLNTLEIVAESGGAVADTFSSLQTNNFCIIKSGARIIAATSINRNLESAAGGSLNIFGVTGCSSGLIDDGQYHACDSSRKVWYNKRLKSLIYSSSAIQVPPQGTLAEALNSIIRGIIDSIRRLITPPIDNSYSSNFLKGIKKFDRLYLAKQGTQTISAFIEGKSPNTKSASLEYKGIGFDICSFMSQYSQSKGSSSGISCRKSGNDYYVLVQGSEFTSIDPDSIWQDLTSKLRLE